MISCFGSRAAVALLVFAAASACNNSSTEAVVTPTPECADRVTVTITTGTTPTFTWTPDCPIVTIAVVSADRLTFFWAVGTIGADRMHAPIAYGVIPAGGQQSTPPKPLQAGTTYRLQLGAAVNQDIAHSVADTTFVP